MVTRETSAPDGLSTEKSVVAKGNLVEIKNIVLTGWWVSTRMGLLVQAGSSGRKNFVNSFGFYFWYFTVRQG